MEETRLETRLLRPVDEDFNVEAIIRGTTFKRSLLEDLSISSDGDDLNLWLARQPAKTAYWRIWCGVAANAVEDSRRSYEKAQGRARIAAREADKQRMNNDMAEWGKMPTSVRSQFPKPVAKTVDEISADVENDPEVETAWREYMRAKDVHNVMDASFKAIDSLRSSLVTLAANLRSEQTSFSNKFRSQEDNIQASGFVKKREAALSGVRIASDNSAPTSEPAVEVVGEDIEPEEPRPILDYEEPTSVPGPSSGLVFAIVHDELKKIEILSEQNEDGKIK